MNRAPHLPHIPALAVQHLSDQAVAACADGALTGAAHDRAQRHLAECPDCARAVADQRHASAALRTAPLPALPAGLLERLCTVPSTTPLDPPSGPRQPPVAGMDDHGRPVFAAYGTVVAAPGPAPHGVFGGPVLRAGTDRTDRTPEPRSRPARLAVVPVGAAAALVVGILAGTAAGAGGAAGGGRVVQHPAAPTGAGVVPAMLARP